MLDADVGWFKLENWGSTQGILQSSLLCHLYEYFIVFHSFPTFLETDSTSVRVGLFVSFFIIIIFIIILLVFFVLET